MSGNYSEYFTELSSNSKTNNELDYGNILNHKFDRARRNYLYTHPNQLRTMTTHASKKTSHSKQNDLLGAIEMLTYKPPKILPISDYTKRNVISAVQPKNKIEEYQPSKSMPSKPIPSKPIPPKPKPSPPKQPSSQDLLQGLVDDGLATVRTVHHY